MNKFNFVQAADGKTLDLYIYGEVVASGYDWWTGEYIESETSADYFRQQLAKFPNITQINLYINSPGGSVMEGYGIYAQLKRHLAYVTAYIDGFACSVASVIAMAADKVIMYSNAMMMIHEMAEWMYGNAKQLRKAADDLDKIMQGNIQVYLQKAAGKLTEEKLVTMLDAETWLTAKECLDIGLCDEISEMHIDPAMTADVMKQMTGNAKQQVAVFKALKQTLEEFLQTAPTATAHAQPTEPTPAPTQEPKQNKPRQLFQGLLK